MDRFKEAAAVIGDISKYRNKELNDYELIKHICNFFDNIKGEEISQADLHFLKYISNVIGIPHFFDLLVKYNHDIFINEIGLGTLSALIYESTLHLNETNKVHKYQKEILNLFTSGKLNRFFLSASTSFGKTHLVFEIIKKMDYKNVVLIFPTIALLSENLEKLISDENYSWFKDNFAIHTLSDAPNIRERNLFIFTPERYLSFTERQSVQIRCDFAFIDEVYKIDNDYIIDEEVRENERDVAYRLAVFYTLVDNNTDALLAGPYIDFSKQSDQNYNDSFDRFLIQNKIECLDYNNYEIVNKSHHNIAFEKEIDIDSNLKFAFDTREKTKRLIHIVEQLVALDNQNAIIYCANRGKKNGVEFYANKIIESGILANHNSSGYSDFIAHVEGNFSEDWILIKALKNGIGIHHGLIPKYIQKEIVSLFNSKDSMLKVLISTTTITEGVNTSAKNLIVMHDKKGDKPLKKFDAKNIAGRAGRFLFHYSGRVIVLQNKFMDILDSEAQGIRHKNYDLQSPKNEIDLFYTKEDYLSESDKLNKSNIIHEQSLRRIPDPIFELYKVISRRDKIIIYDAISTLTQSKLSRIKQLIRSIGFKMDIDNDGFEVLLEVVLPIIKNKKLRSLIEKKDRNEKFSILTHLVHFYLISGFKGSMDYKIGQGEKPDKAISETAEFVYNTLKYQVVKYLGVFNIMYKFFIAQKDSVPLDTVSGIDKLLVKLEYNALSENGRIASDFGVPSNIISFYESVEKANEIRKGFDRYENHIFDKIDQIIKGQNS